MAVEKRTIDGIELGYDTVKKAYFALAEGVGEEKETCPLVSMTVDELIAYAKENNIDIGASTSHGGILKKIKAAEKLK